MWTKTSKTNKQTLQSSSQVKVLWYRTSTQSIDKSRYLKVGLEDARDSKIEDARDVRSLLSANQSERFFQSQCSEFPFQRIAWFPEVLAMRKPRELGYSTKNMFCLRSERSSEIGSIWRLWNQSKRSSTFVRVRSFGTTRPFSQRNNLVKSWRNSS